MWPALAVMLPILVFAQEQNANAPRRFALVIGNNAYSSLPAAPSAVEEARLMKNALAGAGFSVTLVENIGYDGFFNKEDEFVKRVRPGDICLFYYSGHGAQILDDDDYLLPVDFSPSSDKSMEDRAFRLKRLIQDLDQKHAGLKIVIIEAPRRIATIIKGSSGIGLAMPDIRATSGTVVALAAGVGEFIVPGENPRDIGMFTRSVINGMAQAGSKLPDLFQGAKQEVGRKTSQRQLPEWNDSVLPEGFYFRQPAPAAVAPPPDPVVKVERILVPTDVPRNRLDRLEYVRIPAGTFKMGCVPGDSRCDANEKPQHPVTISHGFWMGRTEVEVSAYDRFVKESEKKYKMPKAASLYNRGWAKTNYPMMMVSWEEASAYCGWAGGRLPSEAEWEYAARAGKVDEIYPLNAENSRDKANFLGTKGNDVYDQLAPVHSFDANDFSLYDMAGNVWEWVADWYSPDYYESSPATDPKGPERGKQHVTRGGSFESSWQRYLRISVREPQGSALFKVGFRCVMDDSDRTKQILNLH
jgi:formylglycine-generating enzyme